MDEDPFAQGFSPEYFDWILGLEVLHVSKQLRPMLQNLRSLLKPNGILQFYETTTQCPRITFVFGLLEGYWQFADTDLRPDHITLAPEKWLSTLSECGFASAKCYHAYNNVHGYFTAQASTYNIANEPCRNYINDPLKSWIVLTDGSEFANSLSERLRTILRRVIELVKPLDMSEGKVASLLEEGTQAARSEGRTLEGILYFWGFEPQTRSQNQISLPFVSICQHICKLDVIPKVFVITKGTYSANGSEVRDPSPGSLAGIVRAARNEHSAMKICHLDLSLDIPPLEHLDEAFYNLWVENDGTIALRNSKRLVPRISSHKNTNEPLRLPNGCDRYQLQLPESKMISDLEFTYLDPCTLEDNQIEIQTKTFALNFRDVFCVLKPLPIFEEMNSVGLDYAGKKLHIVESVLISLFVMNPYGRLQTPGIMMSNPHPIIPVLLRL